MVAAFTLQEDEILCRAARNKGGEVGWMKQRLLCFSVFLIKAFLKVVLATFFC